jgi:flagellar biosynthesis/type III secretory pathway M-ring protein FliF/YscJ
VALIVNRRRRKPAEAVDDIDAFLSTLNDAPGSLPPPPPDVIPPQSSENIAHAARQRDLIELADSRPADVARVLRTWLNSKDA